MADAAHRWTDRQITALERRIRSVYRDAAADTQGKLERFVAKFKRDEATFKTQLEEGKITEATYRDWLAGQVFQGKRWRAQLRDLTQTMTRSNELAMEIVNDATPAAFAYNANWASFQMEKGANANMGFGLYDQQTVKRLLRDEPTLLPSSRVNIPKDQRWNMRQISTQITQGILQGEALDTIAKRLQRVAVMNFNSARTHARTAMTGAQNAGRMETYRRAQEMGIKTRKRWLATLDGHTRHAHAALDGQVQDTDKPFESELGAIMYPGDPEASPANVYNCRCTLIAEVTDYPDEHAQRWDNENREKISDMTFAEWAGWKKQGIHGKILNRKGQSGIIEIPNNGLYGRLTQEEIKSRYIDEHDHNLLHETFFSLPLDVQQEAVRGYDAAVEFYNGIKPPRFIRAEKQNRTWAGGYSETRNVVIINTHAKQKIMNDVYGTVIHEMTHCASKQKLFDSEAVYAEALKAHGWRRNSKSAKDESQRIVGLFNDDDRDDAEEIVAFAVERHFKGKTTELSETIYDLIAKKVSK